MTADQIIEQIISLPPAEAKKIADYISSEDFSDALEAHQAKKEFLESGEPGIPAEDVFKELGL